ncbi:hypothetical protein [Synechococcus sp. 1G10]|uniref:DUF6998 domain-containing protein n=1 Tax=Synechococcus sp. 1G10 TaxID=2025605 RepID=UPI001E4B3A0C|nr:hypothetical protein [Synechococcus sp. 1G10]
MRTAGNANALRGCPPHLLVLRLEDEGTDQAINNGPGERVWAAAGKTSKRNGQRQIGLATLARLQQDVPSADQLHRDLTAPGNPLCSRNCTDERPHPSDGPRQAASHPSGHSKLKHRANEPLRPITSNQTASEVLAGLLLESLKVEISMAPEGVALAGALTDFLMPDEEAKGADGPPPQLQSWNPRHAGGWATPSLCTDPGTAPLREADPHARLRVKRGESVVVAETGEPCWFRGVIAAHDHFSDPIAPLCPKSSKITRYSCDGCHSIAVSGMSFYRNKIDEVAKSSIMLRALFLSAILSNVCLAKPAYAGCGDWSGMAQICYKGRCEIQRGTRHCSSVGSGNTFETVGGYQFWYDDYVANLPTTLKVTRMEQVLWEGAPEDSPWSIFVCGDTIFRNSCDERKWVDPRTGAVTNVYE